MITLTEKKRKSHVLILKELIQSTQYLLSELIDNKQKKTITFYINTINLKTLTLKDIEVEFYPVRRFLKAKKQITGDLQE